MGLGARTATFTGAVGGTNPFGMTVSSAGGIDFSGNVTLGGNFNLSSEGTGVDFAGTLNGDHSVTINSTLGDISLGTVGDVIPIAGFSTSSGSGTLTLNGDIFTEGGALSFGQKVTITSDRTIRTGLGLSPLGASISFTKGVLPSVAGIDLTINPGSNGSIIFADGLGVAADRFNNFTLEQGGGLTIGGASSGIFTTGDINILPKVFGSFPKSTVRFDSESGDITLDQGAVLTGLFSDANNNSDGSNFVAEASLGTVTINGVLDVSGGDNDTISGGGSGYNSGSITITANEVALNTLQALGGDADTVGNGGTGGKVTITFTGSAADSLTANSILTDGGEGEGIVGGIGGDVEITRESALGDILIGTISSRGGDSADNFGGQGGNITITAQLGDLSAPTSFFANGGKGSDDAFAGSGGLVVLKATDGNISFQNQSLTLTGDGGITIIAGKSIVLATSADFTTPSNSSGGVVITSNEDAPRTDRRGVISLQYGSANTVGELYMPSSAYLISNGGKIAMDVKNTSGLAGAMTLSGITTSAANLNAGSIQINQDVGSGLGNVTILGSIDANGGEPASTGPLFGRNGGSVLISGLAVSVQQINTSGSASLAAATVPAFGGSGGDVTITGTSILIRAGTVPATGSFAINTSGGTGLGTGNANGGSGGNIQLDGNVTLDSGDASKTTIILNTQGGVLAAGGVNGIGGNITVTGTLTGTETTSNILDLRYGSGTVALGSTAADTITLGTLITAGDDARSTGTITVTGALDVDTLTTYGRGYSIEILGNGSNVTGAVTFLNTGVVELGSAGGTVTFTGGFDALTGGGGTPFTAPAQLRLAGTIVSGNSLTPGSGASMLMGPVQLIGNTSLNSNVNEIRMGNVTGDFNLELLAGIGAAQVTFDGNVGTLAADGSRTAEINNLFIRSGVTGNVEFGGVLVANSLTAEAGTSVTLTGNTDLLLGGSFGAGSQLELNNVEFADFGTNLQVVNRGGVLVYDGAVTMLGGPIEMTGAGDFELGALGTLDGDFELNTGQNLILSGTGSKDFGLGIIGGAQAVGTGLGAAITMSGGDVTFGALTTASGLVSSTADVTFNGTVTLGNGDTDTTLDANVTFNSAMFTSTDAVFFGNDGADVITLLGELGVGGVAAYTFSGAVNGGFGITLDGEGTKTFEGVVGTTVNVTGLTQVAGSGLVVFEGDVETSAGNEFNGSVTLSGISFTAGAATNLGGSSANTITLNTGGVTLRGAGNYTVNGALTGAQALTLDDAGIKTFASTANIAGFTQEDGTGIAIFQGNVTTSGASTFNSLVTFSGMTFSAGGATTLGNAAGDTITLSTGTVTLGGAGAYTLNGAMAGAQALILAGNNTKTFNSTVTVGNGTTAMTQANTAGNNVSFAENLVLNGASSFAQQVTLDGMTVTASGATGLNTVVLSGGAVTLQGAGAYTTSGTVSGAQDFTLSGSGTKTFASTINSANLTQTGGQIRLGGSVTTGVVDLENAATTSAVTVNSSGLAQTYDALTLGGNLTAQSGAGLATLGVVGGSGSLSLLSDAVDLLGAVQNQGSFSAQTAGLVDLGGAYLSGAEVARIFSSKGANFISTGADATADTVIVNTSLSLNGATGAGVRDTTVNGALSLVTGGVASFDGTLSSARSLGITAASIASGGTAGLLDLVSIPSLGGINLSAAGADFAYLPVGNLNLTGRITLNNGDVVLAPTGNFVNNFSGNPFAGATTRILTRDFFSYPDSAGVPGLTPVFGVTSIFDVGANQIGVAIPLSAGSAGPYISEFTTGTGQPYILATQENAVPAVVMPAAYTVAGAFPTRVSYSAEELEMMTPEERSAYEAEQRRQSARVILEQQPGQAEVGVPAEGQIPQAMAPEPAQPAPTARVILDGKPLAGRSDKEKGDSSQLLRIRPAKAVALRLETNGQEVMENERLAAEVNVGSAPVAGR
jgi:hypothetical protein